MWRLLEDVYRGDRAWLDYRADGTIEPRQNAQRYLPQLPGEEASEYKLRLLQSHFDDRFAQSCRDFVGLVFNKGVRLEGVPSQISKHWTNLDGAGLTGDRLCGHIGMAALRLSLERLALLFFVRSLLLELHQLAKRKQNAALLLPVPFVLAHGPF